jgi:hypothetical protein
MTDRRALSDAIGFVLVFAVITASIGVFYATGFNGLESARTEERTNNAERAFDVLRANMEDISARGAPSRATEIKVSDAKLYVGDKASINLTLRYHGNGSVVRTNETTQPGPITYRPIVYESADGTSVVYANGAVFRRSQGGYYSMTQQPGYVVSDRRVLLTVFQTQSATQPTAAGSDTVLVRALARSRSVVFAASATTYDLDVDMTTPRADAWKRYFEDKGATCSVSGDDLSCTFEDVETIHVTRLRAELLFE